MPSYKLQKNGLFTINDYNRATPFSNFLPGIAGAWGIPLWAFYVNRGQALSSFGLKDKNGAIAEFYPANKAYSLTPFFGFRTFIKNSSFYEPFGLNSPQSTQTMLISSSCLDIIDSNPDFGLKVGVKYFTLPNQPVAALVRKVTFKNISKKKINFTALDGLARVIPYGTANSFLKEMSRTVEAWMHAYFSQNFAFFRLITDPADTAQVSYTEGANFNYSFYRKNGERINPPIIADPNKIFGENLSYSFPEEFIKKSFKPSGSQILCGRTPSAFSFLKLSLAPQEKLTFYNLFGAAPALEPVKKIAAKLDTRFLAEKESQNNSIIESIKDNAFSLSGSTRFSCYVGSSYLDNILRGGFPYKPDQSLAGTLPYYIYSRKHGDPERDYNYFNLLPSFFSEGQGNYRDVNQNRRLDLFFQPSLEEENITYFLNLTQIDGYNPLVVEGQKLYLDEPAAKKILKKHQIKKKKFLHLLIKGFYLGEFLDLLSQENGGKDKEELSRLILKEAKRRAQASHGEGYWIDHWRYSLDLIENFLSFYPDRLKKLFLETEFTFFDDKYKIKPRRKRYVLRKGKVYQGESIEVDKDKAQVIKKRKDFKNLLRSSDGKFYKTNLVEKLLVLILNKAASFDPDGLGIEMEADKPGWCDSLNGLPALFGSSFCETLELKRAALMLKEALAALGKDKPKSLRLAKNTYTFFSSLDRLIASYRRSTSKERNLTYWDKSNKIKESFRKNSFYSLSPKTSLKTAKLENFLSSLLKKIEPALKKAKDKKTNLFFTYFTYQVTSFKKTNHHPFPLSFRRSNLPLFLEGVVHGLRSYNFSLSKAVPSLKQKKQSLLLHQNTKKSPLFDKKLKMYKLNASLAGQPLEIGRSRVFTPGWLENESIWLHMEYKYLLELLKAGLYRQFFAEFKDCAVCFQDPKVYGRSILENSSFLVSSAHPDRNLHAKGFVARLTGATAELINIWAFISLGPRPFSVDKKGRLQFKPSPLLEQSFFTKESQLISWQGEKVRIPKDTYAFKLFSKTLVVYHNPKRLDTFSSECRLKKIEVEIEGKLHSFAAVVKDEPLARAIRAQKADRIDIHLA